MTVEAITEVPESLRAEVDRLAEEFESVAVRRVDSDLPGFDLYELDASTACRCGSEECDGPLASSKARRLVLKVPAGTIDGLSLDESEVADVMWALAGATGRNRRHAEARDRGGEYDPERATRFDCQRLVMMKLADSVA